MSNQALNKMSRRELLRLLGMSSASMLLSACSQVVPQVVKETVVVQETVIAEAGPGYEEGELKVFVCCYSPPEVELRENFNVKFQETYPGAQISMELLPAGQNYFEKLQTLIAAGTPPDVFDMWEGYVQPYAANGALLELDPFFEADAQVKKDDLLPAAFLAGSWQDKVYAFSIGFMPGPISLYYNVDHFDKAGLDHPSSDWIWDDMQTAAKALAVDENSDNVPEQWGLVFDLWFVPWLYWIWSNGGDVRRWRPSNIGRTWSM
jgi:multiple sugar transport system substrate-binding protein